MRNNDRILVLRKTDAFDFRIRGPKRKEKPNKKANAKTKNKTQQIQDLDTSESEEYSNPEDVETPEQVRQRARDKLRKIRLDPEYVPLSEQGTIIRLYGYKGYVGLSFAIVIRNVVSLSTIDAPIDLAILLDLQSFTEVERSPDAIE